ncbi:tetratricopeptide repeat protein, partial [Myxococcus sp. 1LA]
APRPAPQPAAAAPQPAPAPVAPPAPVGMGREQLSKLLTETDVYVKYGLHDKALEHLRKIFSVEPENLDAHEKAYQIYVASGNMAQASEQLLNVLRLCTRSADVPRAQPYLATILQENPAHPEVPAFLSVLRTEGPVVAAPTVSMVESVGEDAILVDSSDDEILVAPPPEDALLHPPGDELALTTLPSGDSDEVIEEDSDSTVISEEALVGEAITSGEFEVYGTPEPEDLAAASVDETLVTDDDRFVLTDEPGLGVTDDEPLVASSDDDLAAAAAYSLEDESLVDDGTATSMDALSLGDDEPQPTQMHAPSRTLLDEASPDTLQVPTLDSLDMPSLEDDAPPPLDIEDVPTRVGAAPLSAADLDEDPFGTPELGGPTEFEEPTASHAIVAVDDEPVVEDSPDLAAYEAEEPVAYEEPAAEPEPEPEPEVEAAADEEEPAAEECDEASFFLDQGLLEEAREILETVMIAFPGHARAAELMERLEAAEAGGGAAPEEAPSEPAHIPSVQPVTEGFDEPEATTGERDAFDLAAELAGEIDTFGDDSGATALPAEEDFQYSVEEVFSEFKKSLAKVVKPEDVDTHYDLGIAYKEMGLLDDALHEFDVARQGSAGGKRELDCITMMGMLQLLRGDAAAAVEAFREGLGNPHATGEAAKALGFELASAYEAQGDAGKALFHFQRVAAMDGKYRDVSGHVSRLAASVEPVEDPLPMPSGNGAKATSSPPAPAGAPAPTTPIPTAGASKARKVGYL